MTTKVGDDESGFSVGADVLPNTLRVVGWGFWSDDVAQSFDKTVIASCRQSAAERLLLEMSQLKPMREAGQRAFAALLPLLRMSGITHTTIVTSSPLTKLQLLRIVREAAPKDVILFTG